MLDAELEGQNDFGDDYDDLGDEVDSAGGSPRSGVVDGDGAAALAEAAGPAARADPLAAASGGGGQGSVAPAEQSAARAAAAAAAVASVARSHALEGPGDSSTVMCADMHGDAAEEHASAAPGAFAVDGVMRWGKKRKR